MVLQNTKTPKIAATVVCSVILSAKSPIYISFFPKVVSESPKLQKVNKSAEHLSNLDATVNLTEVNAKLKRKNR